MNSIQHFFMTSPFDLNQIGEALWLIILFPALGAFINGVFGRVLGRGNVNFIATAAVGASFLISLMTFWTINDLNSILTSPFTPFPHHYAVGHDYGTWFAAGNFRVDFALRADHLSGTLLLVITGVGFLIHLYSTAYMEHDEGYWRYFAYLNLFVAAMLTLVLGDNLLLLFVGWEGVGLCSYLLIGFWYSDQAKAYAGRKAFITNRIGDFGFLLATFLLVLLVNAFQAQSTDRNFGSLGDHAAFNTGLAVKGPLDFTGLEVMARTLPVKAAQPGLDAAPVTLQDKIASGPLSGLTFGGVLTAILLLFLLGATGKSAQLPLYVWLPDAMAGPTPVSALIHAATMVTAGVYLFSRISFLLVLSPFAMSFVAMVGALTALFAALIAFAQDDIKKVLAYSTVSQLGYMFLGVGVGAFWAAVLHLVTHAFFKACLFLGSGSVMHGNADETDVKKLGGLSKLMPITYVTFGIATLAITGFVPLSGFFSKDAILDLAHGTTLHGAEGVAFTAWVIGLVAAVCTAFYMTRLFVLTFWGERSKQARIPAEKVHESSWPMTVPLIVLSALSVLAIGYGVPLMENAEGQHEPVMENFLSPVFRTASNIVRTQGTLHVEAEHGAPWGAWGIAWALAIAGTLFAWWLYTKFFPARVGQPVPALAKAAQKWARDKFYVDELYEYAVIKPVKGVSLFLFKVMDAGIIDTVAVRGTAWVTARTGSVLRYFQTGDAQSYAAVMALALLGGIAWALITVLQ